MLFIFYRLITQKITRRFLCVYIVIANLTIIFLYLSFLCQTLWCIWRIKFHFSLCLPGYNPLQYDRNYQNCIKQYHSFLLSTFSYNVKVLPSFCRHKNNQNSKNKFILVSVSYCIISFLLRLTIFEETFCNIQQLYVLNLYRYNWLCRRILFISFSFSLIFNDSSSLMQTVTASYRLYQCFFRIQM